MKIKRLIAFISTFFIAACSNLKNIKTVENVDIEKYSGKWYEIVRLENRFENGLENIYTIYTPTNSEKIDVENVGYDSQNKKKIAKASAYPLKGDYAKMRIVFFYPFYGDYAITMLAKDYSYALVESPPYLWILSRNTYIAPNELKKILAFIKAKGIDISKLIYVKHTRQG